jgi:hypothetical protein
VKEPSRIFLASLAEAIREAEHQNVAQRMVAGLLWAMYPEWFDAHFRSKPDKEGPQ